MNRTVRNLRLVAVLAAVPAGHRRRWPAGSTSCPPTTPSLRVTAARGR